MSLVIQGSGKHTERVQRIAASDQARALLHGAYGRLVITRPARKKQLWVAGGIGVTPFLSIADEIAAHPDRYEGYDVILIVVVGHPAEAFKFAQLEECAGAHPGLTVHLWDREKHGRPTIEAIRELFVDDITERAVMLSGPEPMIADLTRQLLAIGVTRGQIRSERGIGPPGRWDVASPALRYIRIGATVLFAAFVIAVLVSTIARAIGA